ncbi:hypothetical protein PILCRDRAFT_824521 [Piloderma croceum F 1598]|uniref:Uncharacterized protein n=1 Tax=Piloderma croceum (strain F 1598) TaxID=765440 RepID=A0A0C3FED0_PILCF|nr:hypothetical protein PILCRDRAFT_824521 [Piloderma croceum F 1598]
MEEWQSWRLDEMRIYITGKGDVGLKRIVSPVNIEIHRQIRCMLFHSNPAYLKRFSAFAKV